MTEDYKNKLLKYFTGKLSNATGTNTPQFIDKGTVNYNIEDYLTDQLGTNLWTYTGDCQDANNEYIFIYGSYVIDNDPSDNIYGFIYVTKNDLEPVVLFKEYKSGTKFRDFVTLEFDEDGYMYGVDSPDNRQNVDNPDYRFIMLNKLALNIAKGNNVVELRQSYNFPTTIDSYKLRFSGEGENLTTKKIGSANYYFFPSLKQGSTVVGGGVVALEVKVGESNTWQATANSNITYDNGLSFINQYNGDNFNIIIGCLQKTTQNVYTEAVYASGETPTLTVTSTLPAAENGYISTLVKTTATNTFVAYTWADANNTYMDIYKVDYTNNILVNIMTFSKPYSYLGDALTFVMSGASLFFKYTWYYRENGSNQDMVASYVGMIINDNFYYINGSTYEYDYSRTTDKMYVNNVFNLYSIYIPMVNDKSQKIQLVYNVNNYNGLAFENKTCLVPTSSILYDSNSDIIFARNLYNKTVSGQTTTSTVQVPNTLLNDVTIAENTLLGQTNVVLVDDDTETTKNIYELVNINFANTLIMRNDNDENNKILNPVGATRLNNSISQTTDYDATQASKIKVNYTDNTNIIIPLNTGVQVTLTSDTTATYSFALYIAKEIDNIQIISFDENTVYQTIDTLNLTVGKYYNISQDVEIL